MELSQFVLFIFNYLVLMRCGMQFFDFLNQIHRILNLNSYLISEQVQVTESALASLYIFNEQVQSQIKTKWSGVRVRLRAFKSSSLIIIQMQNSQKNESCEQSMSIEAALTEKCLEIEPNIEKDSQFVEILVDSYLKLAYVYVQQVQKPIMFLQKVRGISLKTRGRNKKTRKYQIGSKKGKSEIINIKPPPANESSN